MPESSSFILVDLLHRITLFFILATIASNAYCLNLIKKDKIAKAYRFDAMASHVVIVAYLLLNVWFIWKAALIHESKDVNLKGTVLLIR